MGSISNLAAFKKKVALSKFKLVTRKDEVEAVRLVMEGLWSQWTFHRNHDTLNEFISERLFDTDGTDWVNDRNAVAELEQNVNLQFSLESPGYTFDNLTGWRARFVWTSQDSYETPVLRTELEARVYCVLMYFAVASAVSEVHQYDHLR